MPGFQKQACRGRGGDVTRAFRKKKRCKHVSCEFDKILGRYSCKLRDTPNFCDYNNGAARLTHDMHENA